MPNANKPNLAKVYKSPAFNPSTLVISSLRDLLKAFPDEPSCIAYLERVLWPNGPVSPFDSTSKVYRRKDGQYRCKNTGKNFTVRNGTMFEQTRLPLRTWFTAIFLITTSKKGISSVELSNLLGVTQKTSWFLEHRIRATFGMTQPDKLYGEVEMDETFVGGKNANRHRNKKAPNVKGRAFVDKVPVFGMLERGGKVRVQVVPNTTAKTLTKPILQHVDPSATIFVDDWKGYQQVRKRYKHGVVAHGNGIYANGTSYTNNIEAFWGNFCKRSINGTFNFLSRKHMQSYFDEFAWRYNERDEDKSTRFYHSILYCAKRTDWDTLVSRKAFKSAKRKRQRVIHVGKAHNAPYRRTLLQKQQQLQTQNNTTMKTTKEQTTAENIYTPSELEVELLSHRPLLPEEQETKETEGMDEYEKELYKFEQSTRPYLTWQEMLYFQVLLNL